jgi:oligosaccharide repeat unit polymerase
MQLKPGSRKFVIRSSYAFGGLVTLLTLATAGIVGSSSSFTASFIAFIFFCIVVSYSITRNGLISGPTLFLILMGLFHLGMVVPIYVFEAPPPLMPHRWLDWAELSSALALFVLAGGGVLSGSVLVQRYPNTKDLVQIQSSKPIPPFVLFGLIYIVAVLGYLIYGFKTGILIGLDRGSMLELRETGSAVWFGLFRQWLVISAIGLIAFGGARISLAVVILSLVLFLPIFILGDRGFFIVTAAAFLVVLRIRRVIFPTYFYLLIGWILFLLIPILRNARGGVESFATGFLDPFYEMGLQLRVVIFTMDAVDKGLWGLEYGKTYLSALGRILPNIGPLRYFFGGGIENSPSYIITELYNSGGSGLGMSVIAEAYVNFGWVGAFLIPFLLGLLLTFGERFGRINGYALTVYGSALSSILFLARGDFFLVSRPFAWAIAVVLFFYAIERSLRRN